MRWEERQPQRTNVLLFLTGIDDMHNISHLVDQ